MADEDTSLAADLSAAMGSTSTQPATETAATTVDATAPTGTATTEPAAAATADTSTESDKGPIPFPVHKTALENARSKAVAEWEQQYGWAKQHQREAVERAIEWQKAAQADPIEFLNQFSAQVMAHPEYGPQLRSFAARTLAARQQQPAEAGADYSHVILDLGNGQSLPVSKLIADIKAQAVAEAEQKFAPVKQTFEQLQKAREKAEFESQVTQFSASTFEDIKTWIGMDDPAHQKLMGEKLAALSIDGNDPREVLLAATRIHRTDIVPKLQQARLSDQVQQTNLKAQANTVSPTAPTAGTPKSYSDMSWAEAFQHELAARRT